MSRLANSQARNRRDRPTRVDVAYTLHLPEGTQVQQRLPFVIGIIADVRGDVKPEPPPKEGEAEKPAGLADPARQFSHIHKDNFDEILAFSKPYLKFTVADVLRGQGLTQVELDFKALEDFHPDQIIRQIPALAAEQKRRKRLEVLLGMLGSDPRLEERLQEIVDNPAKRSEFLAQMAQRETGEQPR